MQTIEQPAPRQEFYSTVPSKVITLHVFRLGLRAGAGTFKSLPVCCCLQYRAKLSFLLTIMWGNVWATRSFHLEYLSSRFPHIARKLLENLGDDGFAKFIKVCRPWKKFPVFETLSLIEGLYAKNPTVYDDSISIFQFAVETGHFTICKLIIDTFQSDNPSAPNPTENSDVDGNTPLHTAARHGHLEVFKLLLVHAKDKNPENNEKVTPFQMAATCGNWSICPFIVGSIGDLNLEDEDVNMLLHKAARDGNMAICKLIIDRFQSDNPSAHNPTEESDEHGNTPLHTAARHGHLEVFKLLLVHANEKNPANNEKVTPFQMAATCGNWSICLFIVGSLGDLNLEDEDGNTLLHKAASDGNLALYQSIIDSVDDKTLDKNPKNYFGETPFYLAGENNHLDLCRLIIDYAEDKNPESKCGNTLLHKAAKDGNLSLYQLIIDKIEDKNPKNIHGDTPFHIAAENGHLEMCQILFDTYNVLGKQLKIEALGILMDKVADNGHFMLIQWINDNNIIGDF